MKSKERKKAQEKINLKFLLFMKKITLKEFWTQSQTTRLKSSTLMQFLAFSPSICPFIESKMIQAFLSYIWYSPVNRICGVDIYENNQMCKKIIKMKFLFLNTKKQTLI